MATREALNVELPDDLLKLVRRKVASGDFADVGEVLSEGLRALQARDAALEIFLREDVAESVDAFRRDPAIGIPARQVAADLDARHSARLENAVKK